MQIPLVINFFRDENSSAMISSAGPVRYQHFCGGISPVMFPESQTLNQI
jgi:hypothetical protein